MADDDEAAEVRQIPYGYADAMRSVMRVPGIDDAWLRGVLYENAAALFYPTGVLAGP